MVRTVAALPFKLPAASKSVGRYSRTAAPSMPGAAPSAASIMPLLFLSCQTRLPSAKVRKMPKSWNRFASLARFTWLGLPVLFAPLGSNSVTVLVRIANPAVMLPDEALPWSVLFVSGLPAKPLSVGPLIVSEPPPVLLRKPGGATISTTYCPGVSPPKRYCPPPLVLVVAITFAAFAAS